LIHKSDRELMQDFQSGDVEAFSELYRRHKQGLWLYCLKITGDENFASDVFQDILTKIIYKKELYSGNGSVVGWLFKIARNHCLNFKSRKRNSVSIDGLQLEALDDLESNAESHQNLELINSYIEKLPDDQRDAILLHDVNGISYPEMALITDATIEVLRMRVHRARKQLRTWLEPILFNNQ